MFVKELKNFGIDNAPADGKLIIDVYTTKGEMIKFLSGNGAGLASLLPQYCIS